MAGFDGARPDISKSPRLSDVEVKDALRRAHAGDVAARDKLVEANLRLVASLARRLDPEGKRFDDLFQVGCLALMKAIDKFDLSYDVRFSTYAVPVILGEMRRHLSQDTTIRLSRSLRELSRKVKAARDEAVAKDGREPSIGELAQALGVSREDIVMAADAESRVLSLHEPASGGDEGDVYLIDQVAQQETPMDMVDSISLKEAIESLDPRLRAIVSLRFFEHRTQSQVAQMFGVSQVQVSRLEKRALKAMRRVLSS